MINFRLVLPTCGLRPTHTDPDTNNLVGSANTDDGVLAYPQVE